MLFQVGYDSLNVLHLLTDLCSLPLISYSQASHFLSHPRLKWYFPKILEWAGVIGDYCALSSASPRLREKPVPALA
jgi:hypothetical protein